MKLLIAIPSLDFMHSEFVKSLTGLLARLSADSVPYTVAIQSGTLVYVARDKLANMALEGGYTDVLWLDSDMVFNDDLLDDLRFCGHRMVSAIYHGRRPPHFSCVFRSIDPIDRFTNEDYPTSAFKIAGCGFGGVLMDTGVIQAVKDAFGTCFLPLPKYGEDLAFCERVAKCGIEMWAEPSARMGHIGHVAIYPEDESSWMNQVINGG